MDRDKLRSALKNAGNAEASARIAQRQIREALAEPDDANEVLEDPGVLPERESGPGIFGDLDTVLAHEATRPKRRQRPQRPAPSRPKPDPGVWTEASNFPGVFLGPISSNGLAFMRISSHGGTIEATLNPFEGAAEVDGIPPGFGQFRVVQGHDYPDPGTAHEMGRANAARWTPKIEQLDGNLPIYGPKDGRQVGGWMVYPNLDWVGGCPDGLRGLLAMCVGWANRSAIWRLDRDAWDAGEIRYHQPDDPFEGHDRGRSFAMQGYREGRGKETPAYKIHGFGQLDGDHLGRHAHPAAFLAKHRFAFGTFSLFCLAGDVRLSWTTPNYNDEKPDEKANTAWWSCYGIQYRYPSNQGCFLTGRAFAQAMMVLANAAERGLPFEDDLELMARTVLHVWDPTDDAILALTMVNPATGSSLKTPYEKKLAETGPAHPKPEKRHSIPPGRTPTVQKGFEECLNLLAIRAAVRALLPGRLRDDLETLEVRLHNAIDSLGAELRVFERPEWSSPAKADWTDRILGKWDDKIRTEMQTQPWYAASNGVSAYTGDFA